MAARGSEVGLKPQLIGYRGTGPALNNLMSGQIDFFSEQIVSVAAAAKAGSIKAYAITPDQATPALPGVLSAKDAGAPPGG